MKRPATDIKGFVKNVINMFPAILAALRVYAPYITFPVALIVGVIGYNIEGLLSDRQTPYKKLSIEEEREERHLREQEGKDSTKVDSLKEKKFVPKTVFEQNVSPSLQEK